LGRVGSATEGGQPVQTAAIAISSVEGGSAALPCDITARENDSVYLVLWYRQDSGTPIYRYYVCMRFFGTDRTVVKCKYCACMGFFGTHRTEGPLKVMYCVCIIVWYR
jgi:hypothetical protein